MTEKANLKQKNIKFLGFLSNNSTLVIFIVILLIALIALPKFRTVDNILTVIRQFSLITIVAAGQAVVLISGGFDLSVGPIATLASFVTAYLIMFQHMSVPLACIIGVLTGAACGVINGLLISRVKINPLIATLSTSLLFQGVLLVATKGWPISELTMPFTFLGQGYFLKIPIPIYFMAFAVIVVSILMSKTIYGRYVYAIGGNERTSSFVGINVANIKLVSYVICGSLAAVAGIILTSRLGTAQIGSADTWSLPSIAAAVIGGISLAGGKGKVFNVVVGAALLGIIGNILVSFRVSSYWQSLATGFILLIAVSIDSLKKN